MLRHALGMPLDGLEREPGASGVMMLPIPEAGTLQEVRGQDAARAVPGVTGLEITIPRGRPVVPLPDGDRYLGFVFARGDTPADVEAALRAAHTALEDRDRMKVLLVATYELGQQPGALGSAAAHLQARGHEVRALDVSVDPWDPALVEWADEVAFSVPMHTATRLARDLARGIDRPVRAFGLYADAVPRLRDPGRVGCSSPGPRGCCRRSTATPASTSAVNSGSSVRSSRPHGCAHRCRHCPVPVVFDGRVRRVDEDAVLADIAQLVAAGAEHITFGDPDFLNAPPHSRRIVAAMHERFPDVTFDCTVKVEHVLRHADAVARVRRVGLRVRRLRVRVGRRRGARAPRQGAHRGRRRARGHDPARRRHRGAAVVAALHAVDDTRRPRRAARLRARARSRREHRPGAVQRATAAARRLTPARPPRSRARSSARGTRNARPTPGRHPIPRSTPSSSSIAAIVDSADDVLELYRQVREAVGAPPVDLSHVTTGRPRLTESWFCCAEPTDLQLTRIGAQGDSSETCC